MRCLIVHKDSSSEKIIDMSKNNLIPDCFLDENRNKKVTYPIYQYSTPNGERLRIVYSGQTITNYTNWDEAMVDYLSLKSKKRTVNEIRESRNGVQLTKITFKEAAEEYLACKKANYEGGEIKYSTYDKIVDNIVNHMYPYFENKSIVEITSKDVMDYSNILRSKELSKKPNRKGEYLPLSASNINQVILYFRAIFRYASNRHGFQIKFDMGECIPFKKTRVEKMRVKEDIGKFLSDLDKFKNTTKRLLEIIAEIQGGIYNQVFAIIFLCEVLGTRIDELTALTIQDFDPVLGTIFIESITTWHPDKEKTNKSFEIYDGSKDGNKRLIFLPKIATHYLVNYQDILKSKGIVDKTNLMFARYDKAKDKNHSDWPFTLKTIDYQRKLAMRILATESGADVNTKEKFENWLDDNWFNNHILRHFVNNYLQENDIDKFDRNEFLGHSNGEDMDARYLVFKKKGAEKIVKVNDELCQFLVKDIEEFKKMP